MNYVNRVSFFSFQKVTENFININLTFFRSWRNLLCVYNYCDKSQRFPLINFLSFPYVVTTIQFNLYVDPCVSQTYARPCTTSRKSGRKLFLKSITSDSLLCRVSLKVLLVYCPRTSLGPFKMAPKRPWNSRLPSRTQGTCMPPLPRIAHSTI